MARLVILGAGIAGHTAAIRARQKLGLYYWRNWTGWPLDKVFAPFRFHV